MLIVRNLASPCLYSSLQEKEWTSDTGTGYKKKVSGIAGTLFKLA